MPIGGRIPISIRLNPLAKIKVFRITMYLDEKYTYYASDKRIARSFNSAKYEMVKIAHEDARKPLLPIISDSPTALQESPLSEWLVDVGSAEGEQPLKAAEQLILKFIRCSCGRHSA